MKRFTFLMCFLLAGLVRADVPEVPVVYNAPSSGYYIVIDDRILTCSDSANPHSLLGLRLPGALFEEYSQALVVATYYNEKWASTAVTANPPGLAQALILPLRSGTADVVYWAVLFSFSCLPEDYVSNGLVSNLCPGWGPVYSGTRIKAGMEGTCSRNSSVSGIATMQDYVNFFADAQYQPAEPEESDVLSEDERAFFSLLFSTKIEELSASFQSALSAKRSFFEELAVIREKVFYLMVVVFFLLGSVFYICFMQKG